jgi:5-methylcytosine-specific restriction endonuclease McrA
MNFLTQVGYKRAVKMIGPPERCDMCGKKFPEALKKPMTSSREYPDQPTIDHIIPKSKGGGNNKENLRWVCFDCNQLKADEL